MEIFRVGNRTILYKDGDKIIKEYRGFIPGKLEKQIIFNQSIKDSYNCILPISVVNDKTVKYTMPYIDGLNLLELLKTYDIDSKKKEVLIGDLTNALNSIHKYLIVGDINIENILLTGEAGYLLDFDFATLIGEKEEPICKFGITNEKLYPLKETINTDKFKLYIEILCLLYHLNIEKYAIYDKCNSPFLVLENLFAKINHSDYVVSYLNHCKENIENKKELDDFDIKKCDIEKESTLIREKIANELKN